MTDPRDDIAGDAPDVTAAELALGLLDGAERAAALRRMLAEPGFAHAVARWRDRFADWYEAWPEAAAPEGLQGRIDATLDAPTRVRGNPAWRPLAIAASVMAACLALLLVLRPAVPVAVPPPTAPPAAVRGPVLVAALAPAKGGTSAPVGALYDPQAGTLRIAVASYAPAGRAAELWIIPAGGAPHALGILKPVGATAVPVGYHDRARLAAGATLAVSIEPPGGSPKPTPTGPVVATGALSLV